LAETSVNIGDVIQWMSASSTLPVLGFPKKFGCQFIHDCNTTCKCRPTASTCDLKIKLPVHIDSVEEMEVMMVSAIKDCGGFGLI
jgi:hypothetical protein